MWKIEANSLFGRLKPRIQCDILVVFQKNLMGGCELVCTWLSVLTRAVLCEHRNEIWFSKKHNAFLSCWETLSFPRVLFHKQNNLIYAYQNERRLSFFIRETYLLREAGEKTYCRYPDSIPGHSIWYLWCKSGSGAGPSPSTSPFVASTTPPILHAHLLIHHQAFNHEIPIQTLGGTPVKNTTNIQIYFVGKSRKI